MDIYCTSKNRFVKIIDFNSFGPSTDSLLFEWREILDDKIEQIQFRIVESEIDGQGNQPAYTHNRLPKEAFDFSGDGSSIAEFAERFSQSILESL